MKNGAGASPALAGEASGNAHNAVVEGLATAVGSAALRGRELRGSAPSLLHDPCHEQHEAIKD
jgi:hypothetical protein